MKPIKTIATMILKPFVVSFKATLKPTVTRLGTAVSTYLAASGMAAEQVAAVEAAMYVLAGFAVDLITRWIMTGKR